MKKTVRTTKCKECGTTTSCRNGICALCLAGITQIHDELKELLKEDKDSNLYHKLKKKVG